MIYRILNVWLGYPYVAWNDRRFGVVGLGLANLFSTVLLCWILFFIGNVIWEPPYRRNSAITVKDIADSMCAGEGVQKRSNSKDPPHLQWIEGLVFLDRGVTDFCPEGNKRCPITADSIRCVRKQIIDESNASEPKSEKSSADDEPVVSLYAKSAIDFLRLKRAFDAEPTKNPFEASWLDSKAADFFSLDPLLASKDAIADSKKTIERSKKICKVFFAGAELPTAHRADLDRFSPFSSNRQLSIEEENVTASGTFSILFFPPNSQLHAFGLEIRRSIPGWREPMSPELVEARYFVLDTTKPRLPHLNSRRPSEIVVRRDPWIWGFRPIAIRISEPELANRFFAECTAIAKSADVKLRDVKDKDKCVRAIADFLMRRLASASDQTWHNLPGDLDGESLPPPTRSLDETIVWLRRFNGGNAWGLIQFVVVAATILFFAKLAGNLWLLHDLQRSNSEAQSRLPPTVRVSCGGGNESLAQSLDARLATMKYILAAIPLVGFLGSVAGLSNALVGSSEVSSPNPADRQMAIHAMQTALGTAFDKSIFAFFATIFCLAGFHYFRWREREILRGAQNAKQ